MQSSALEGLIPIYSSGRLVNMCEREYNMLIYANCREVKILRFPPQFHPSVWPFVPTLFSVTEIHIVIVTSSSLILFFVLHLEKEEEEVEGGVDDVEWKSEILKRGSDMENPLSASGDAAAE